MDFTLPSFFRPKTLQQRTTLYTLLPTLIILLVMGVISLLLVRAVLLEQWRQTAIARLQLAAHQVDMRLKRPKALLMVFQQQSESGLNRHVADFIIDRIRSLDGVIQVRFEWEGQTSLQMSRNMLQQSATGKPSNRRFHKIQRLEISPPVYDAEFSDETVSLVSEFRDKDNTKLGHLEVKISFYDLIDEIVKSPMWKSNSAFLVDRNGSVLTRTTLFESLKTELFKGQFGKASDLERKTLEQLQKEDSGTLFGPGVPPGEVSVFYRLKEAPWSIVVISPGRLVLEPVIKFRKYYFLISGIGIFLALIFIRMATAPTTNAIRRVSGAADDLARGKFGAPLEVTSLDEVGELTGNFNVMTRQLQERMQLQQAMSVAREVQQNLLPQSTYNSKGVHISGISVYCQETGGDYFDILSQKQDKQQVSVVVGDVVGHGIGAALLMATIRAIVRTRTAMPGSPVEVIGDVNTLLCRDTESSGNFVSLFYLVIDHSMDMIRWVRCGHDPAVVFSPASGEFSELRGDGVVLGVESDWQFVENSKTIGQGEKLILIGSDGVWETENEEGLQFGWQRVKNLMADNCHRSPEIISSVIIEEINSFRGNIPQADDITLVIIKIG